MVLDYYLHLTLTSLNSITDHGSIIKTILFYFAIALLEIPGTLNFNRMVAVGKSFVLSIYYRISIPSDTRNTKNTCLIHVKLATIHYIQILEVNLFANANKLTFRISVYKAPH